MKSRIKLFLVIILFHLSVGSNAQWIPCSGMDGAWCDELYRTDSTLVTYCISTGIYTRDIDSNSWSQKFQLIPMDFTVAGPCIAAFQYYTFYRSFDKGETWDTLDLTANIPYQLVGIDSVLFLNDFACCILKSEDYGSTWNATNNPSPSAFEFTIAAHDSTLFFIDYPQTAVFFSYNKGETWNSLSLAGLPSSIYWIQDICGYGGTWWAALDGGGIYKYSTATNFWTCMNDSIVIRHLSVNTNVLYGCGYGLWQLNSNWNGWILRSDGLPETNVNGFLNVGDTFFCSTDAGVFKSLSDLQWEPFSTGLHGGNAGCISSMNDEVWVTWGSSLYKSEDNGISFVSADDEKFYVPLKIEITDSLYYLFDGKTFYISNDHGDSWSEEIAGLPGFSNSGIDDFAVGDNYIYLGYKNQLYRSGVSPVYWEPAPIETFEDLVSLQAHGNALLILGTGAAPDPYPVKISHNEGTSIEPVTLIPATYYLTLHTENNRFFVSAETKVYISDDDGYTWDSVEVDLSDMRIYDVAMTDEALLVSGNGYGGFMPRIHGSYDNGLTWSDLLGNLLYTGSYSISPINISGNRVIVGTSGSGLWYRDDLLTGIKQHQKPPSNGIFVYPDPANSLIIIRIENARNDRSGTLQIRAMSGQITGQFPGIKFSNGVSDKPVDISNLPRGMYLLSIIMDDGTTLNTKFIKE